MSSRPPQNDEDRSTKRLVWVLVVIGIGIPVLVEVVTLSGLVTNRLIGQEADAPDTPPVVRVGSELLPEVPLQARIVATRVTPRSQQWVFELELRVQNETSSPYRLRLGPVETKAGTVAPDTTTRRLRSGETGTFRAQWTLPPGEEPAYLTVAARRIGEADSTAHAVERRVRLGKVPVRGER